MSKVEPHPKMADRILGFLSPRQFNCNANRDEISLVKYLPSPEVEMTSKMTLPTLARAVLIMVLYEACL